MEEKSSPGLQTINLQGTIESRSSTFKKFTIITGTALGLGSGFAALYYGTLGVFLKPIAKEFGWGRAQTSAAQVLSMLGLAIGAIFVGRIIDRYGPGRVILISIILMSLGVCGMYWLPGNPRLLAGLSFTIGFLGIGTTPPGYISILPRWFDKRLGFALSCTTIGVGLGIMATPVVSQLLILAYGWRFAYIGLACGCFFVGALAWIILFGPEWKETLFRQNSKGLTKSEIDEIGLTFGEAFRTSQFWVLITVILLVTASTLGAGVHIFALLTDRGLSPVKAVAAGSFAAMGLTLGRLFTGILMDKFSMRKVSAFCFLVGGIGLAILALNQSTSFVVLAASVCMFGFTTGAEGDIIPFATRRYFGTKAFASIYGSMFCAFSIGGLIGPISFGLAFDRLGNYNSVILITVFVCAACAAVIQFLGPYQYAVGQYSPNTGGKTN